MANKMRYRYGPMNNRYVAKSGTVAVEQGDMLKDNGSGAAIPVTSNSADSTSLIGVAMKASPATDPSGEKIRTLVPGAGTVFEYTIAASDKHVFGQRFKLSGAQELTAISTWSGAVAVCAETKDASSTVALVSFLDSQFQRTISNT